MAETAVTLRLTANADGVVTGVRVASSEIANLGNSGQRAGDAAAAGFGRARKGVESISQQLAAAKTQVLAFLGAAQLVQTFQGVARMADQWSEVGSRLSLATKGAVGQTQAMEAVYRVSQRTSTAVETTGNLVSRLSSNLAGMGQSAQAAFGSALSLAETINQTFALSGASAAAQANAITQFTQSLAGGILRAEEFNSVIENSPRLAQAIADGMNKSMGELRQAVNDGKVTASDMLRAIQSQAAVIEAEYNRLPLTIGRAWTQLQNSVLQYVGTADQASGASAQLAQGIQLIATHIDVLIGALVTLAKAAVVFYVGAALQRGVVALGTAVALARAEVSAFGVGLAASATAARGLSVGAAAASVATRGLNAALSLFRANPILLLVSGVALLVDRLISARAESERMTETLRANLESAKRALDDFNKTPTLAGAEGLGDASKKIREISRELDELREKQEHLTPPGFMKSNLVLWGVYKIAIGDTNEQIRAHEGALRALGPAQSRAIENETDMLQGLLGVKTVSNDTRAELAGLARRIIESGEAGQDASTTLSRLAQEEGNVAGAAYLAERGMDAARRAASDLSDMAAAAESRMASLRVQLAQVQGGTAAGIRQRYAEDLAAKGGPAAFLPSALAERNQQMEREIALAVQLEAAQKAQADARRVNTASMRLQNKAGEDLARAQADWRDQIARTRAELEGPLKVAEYEHEQRLKKITEALAQHAIGETQAREARAQADEQLRRSTEDIRKNAEAQAERANVVGRIKADLEEEIRLSGLSAQARQVEEIAIRARNEAIDAGKPISDAEIEDLKRFAAQAQATIQAREEMAQAAEEYRNAWVGAAGDAMRAFGDWFARGFKGAKDFARSVKDIFKKLVSDLVTMLLQNTLLKPFQQWIAQLTGAAGSVPGGAATTANGGLGSIILNGFDSLLSGIGKIFGFGGSAQAAVEAGTGTAMDAWTNQLKQAGGLFGMVGMPQGVSGSGAVGFGMSPWLGMLGGAFMGYGMGGDTLGKLTGALTGGALAYSMLMAGGGLAGAAAGAGIGGLFGGVSGMLGAMGPIGWTALAALAINSIFGGKLFGTKFSTESAAQQFTIGQDGASGFNSVTEVRQKSWFRGREWRTTQSPLDAQAQAAINELYETLKKTVATAAQQLGIDVPEIVGGTFRREFDKNGNLTKEFGTIAGKVYYEAQEAFAARLVGENLLAVAKAAGSAAELEQLANAYRGTGEQLQMFATLALSIQEDLLKANGIWSQVDGDGVMTRIVHYIEGIAKAGESLADAYARIQQAITQYGDLIGNVRMQIATHDLNAYQKAQLQVELQYRAQVKQANELAKALGLSGARAEDLAAIEELRAINMADLAQQYAAQAAAQNQQWLQDLSLSDLSPLRDDQKLAAAMEMLQAAVDAGDMQRAQKLAEQVLGLGRDLYASGEDYNALYEQVTGLVGDLSTQSMEDLQGLTNEELQALADLVDGLPTRIAQELAAVLLQTPPVDATPPATPPPPPPAPAPAPVPPPSGGGGGGSPDDMGECVASDMLLDSGLVATTALPGQIHETHDPAEGFSTHPLRHAGRPVLQPCVRLVTDGGAALVCSRSTPFTATDAPRDAPEYSTLAPDMLGNAVWVRRHGAKTIETVVAVEDAGERLVVPLDFGGRSFPAGEDANALIYSHNMMKTLSAGGSAAPQGIMAPAPTSTDDLLEQLVNLTAEQIRRLERIDLDRLGNSRRSPRGYPDGIYY